MSYERVIKKTKEIETILVKMGAEGRGLHAKVSSVEKFIDKKTVKTIRYVASIRNKLVHEDNFELTPKLLSNFENACAKIIKNLQSKNEKSSKKAKKSSSNLKDLSVTIGIGTVALGLLAAWSWFSE